MKITEAATAEFVFSNAGTGFRDRMGLTGHQDVEPTAADPDTALVYAKFDDGTHWATYPEVTGEPHNYMHDLLAEFLDEGGVIQS